MANKYLSITEAAKIMGLSKPRTRDYLTRPDKTVRNESGGFPRVFFLESTVQKAKIKREKDIQKRYADRIALELKRVPRPSPEYITLTEAALLSGYSKNYLKKNLPYKVIKSCNFFFKSRDVITCPAPGTLVTAQNKHGRTKVDVCEICGREFRAYKGVTICIKCKGEIDEEDPYDVIKPRKRQKRKCPICGGLLWEGEYKCYACKTNDHEDKFDPYYAYGSIVL